jgi:hypothetical protein
MARLHMLGEHEHADLRVAATDVQRGSQPFDGMRGGHADVDHDDVR